MSHLPLQHQLAPLICAACSLSFASGDHRFRRFSCGERRRRNRAERTACLWYARIPSGSHVTEMLALILIADLVTDGPMLRFFPNAKRSLDSQIR
jgi:hypothetical protein